ncbi:MAG: hypothetical protein INH41_28120 [Myxococcaceae bacterium]|nr:hypothetical protein [Myxococcaceae bacterium]MCA3016268.1 hypothetical protein [Myxococcaceae bacterium]
MKTVAAATPEAPVRATEPVQGETPGKPSAVATPEAPVKATEPAKPPGAVASAEPTATGDDAPRSAEVTFAAKANGGLVPAFVDIDGLRHQATPFEVKLPAGRHTIVFHGPGGVRVSRDIVVVAGTPQKVLAELKR